MSRVPVVVGIDLSLTSTGIATVGRDGAILLDRLTSSGRAGATLEQRSARLSYIVGRILFTVPTLAFVVIEAPSLGQNRQAGQLDRHGLWWLVVDTLIDGKAVVDVTPATLKKFATGSGAASKDEMLAAAVRRFPDVPVNSNDTADALWLAAAGREHLGHPIVDLPAKHRDALDAVHWPNLTAVSR